MKDITKCLKKISQGNSQIKQHKITGY